MLPALLLILFLGLLYCVAPREITIQTLIGLLFIGLQIGFTVIGVYAKTALWTYPDFVIIFLLTLYAYVWYIRRSYLLHFVASLFLIALSIVYVDSW